MSSPEEIRYRFVAAEEVTADLANRRIAVPSEGASFIETRIGDGRISFYIAETTAGVPVGQVGVNWNGPEKVESRYALKLGKEETMPNIALVQVSHGYRNRGFARVLMLGVLDEARNRGRDGVFLHVGVNNFAARGPYRSLGFKDTLYRMWLPEYQQREDGSFTEPEKTRSALMTIDLTKPQQGRPASSR